MGSFKNKIKRLVKRKQQSPRENTKAAPGKNQEPEAYRKRIMDHRKRILIRTGIVAVVIVAVVLIAKTVVERWHYKDYKVVSSSVQEDTMSTSYVQLDNYLLKYTGDGASLLGSSGKSLWTQAYEMNNPTADACGTTSVIYDEKGTNMVIFGRGGKMGEVSTEMPILKAKVASQGVVAAILEDGENTWINFYSTSGAQIATGMTRVDSPGYPVDLAVSPDGLLIMVTYLYVEDNKTTSYVAFYNFGNTGQGQMDNMVSGYTYEGTLVPQVAYMREGKSVAFCDDGFVLYTGKQIPKVDCEVKVEKEIISTFYNADYVGMVFRSDDAEKQYTLVLYNANGKQVFEENFNIEYTSIKISDDQILMNNDTQLCVFSLKGHEKFNGNLDEGSIKDVFKIDANRYQVIVDSGIKTIKLS
ncbi:DUF5711 family protein [Ruminococcus sp. OA3]|uniref:DUF5711 family protein n=1 Tax=Ruminococcus sp. OA3 TaxID=2914164 RepID=UPI001F0564C8|nr:DUF5711 family protein [Ruminococcus sp. OA3]MCH1984407.1 DUF5711 family protein [Ruminococcus sp. OA3]